MIDKNARRSLAFLSNVSRRASEPCRSVSHTKSHSSVMSRWWRWSSERQIIRLPKSLDRRPRDSEAWQNVASFLTHVF